MLGSVSQTVAPRANGSLDQLDNLQSSLPGDQESQTTVRAWKTVLPHLQEITCGMTSCVIIVITEFNLVLLLFVKSDGGFCLFGSGSNIMSIQHKSMFHDFISTLKSCNFSDHMY